jgi:hypothetical protein
MTDAEGTYRTTKKFDERDNVVDNSFFGPDGALHQDSIDGYARRTWTYNLSEQSDVRFYDSNNREIHAKVYVSSVAPASDGAKQGLKIGDLLVSYDGEVISNSVRFSRMLENARSASRVPELVVLHEGKEAKLKIPPAFAGVYYVDRVVPPGKVPGHENPK